MAGNLGASNDESTWVLTSYLVSNAIVLPISGWLASLFGRKRFFLSCILPVHRQLAALRHRAQSGRCCIFFRVFQGVGGGGLQPMAQAILADTFPPQKRGLAFALYGITAIMAPTIGPTLGGWITDNYSWRWIFFINLPVGILHMVPGAAPGRRSAVPQPSARAPECTLDYIGIALLALGVGALADPARQGPGRRLVRLALHHHAGRRLRRLPDLAGHLGVASKSAHHRRAHVQELQLRQCRA